jgi:hypothetical protein
MSTLLHVTNGDETYDRLKGHVEGSILPWREALVEGPPPHGEGDVQARASFLSAEYFVDHTQVERDLLEQARTLNDLGNYDEVVLWFDHDLFCFPNLLYLLNRVQGVQRCTLVDLPIEGLSSDTPATVRERFDTRRVVSPDLHTRAKEIWSAYSLPCPTELLVFLDDPEWGFRVHSHLLRFPAVKDGLSYLQRLLLLGIEEGHTDFSSLFRFYRASDGRCYGFGDLQIWRELTVLLMERLIDAPLATLHTDGLWRIPLTLTEYGRAVRRSSVKHHPRTTRWRGGVLLTTTRTWYWDEARRELVLLADPPDIVETWSRACHGTKRSSPN